MKAYGPVISLTEKPTGSGGAKELVEMKIRGINYYKKGEFHIFA